jgi:YegS/Rv2252/BmrU family lipid kinase
MKYHLIINPNAGRGFGKKVAPRLIKLMQEKLENLSVYETSAPGDAEEHARFLKEKECIIIAAGGDGTIHEIVNGMINGNSILGIIPLGSGNDFVKMLNLSSNLNSSIAIVAKGKKKQIDVGKMNDRYFPNGIGIGFDATVVEETLKVKKLRGFFIYLYSIFKALGTYRNYHVKIHINEEIQKQEVSMISICNGRAMGGGFPLAPYAKIDDGELDVSICNGLSKRQILMLLPQVLRGNHLRSPHVHFQRLKSLVIESDKGLPVQADGEFISTGLKRIEVSILPNSLRVIHNLYPNERDL